MDQRVLVWAPAHDGRLTCGFLTEASFHNVHCDSWEVFRSELERGVGAVVAAAEFLSDSVLPNLQAILTSQPPWSDMPIIVVGGIEPPPNEDRFRRLGNVSILQRPVAVDTLTSTVTSALRARRRQYEIRDLLRQRDEADQRKDEFLAMLAHELRNPLAPLRTALELLKLGPSRDTVSRAHATMDRQIVHLTRLVDDLLDVSRITRRKILLKKTRLDASQAIKDAIASAQALAAEKGLNLEVHVPDEQLTLEADPVRLEQMVGNLIGNAIKFTPAGGVIHVSLEYDGSWAVVHVRDTGVGIAPENLERVFDLFEQTAPSLDRRHGGLGIGLTVVRLLAELHGGDARIFSAGEGAGTDAAIRLPLHPQDAAAEPDALRGTPARGSARRVLIIDDNPDVVDMLAAYLRQIGHDVLQANDGHLGIRSALEHKPSVIVCDIGLPGLDGYDVARTLRHEPGFESCLLIAVSGYGDGASRDKAHRVGFAHYVTKPADPMLLAELIAAAR
jgi:signal transduction histidine kinase